eukprot:Em0084g1a
MRKTHKCAVFARDLQGHRNCIGGIDNENGDELLRSGCTNRKIPGSSTKYYRFPSDRSLWISALRYRDFVPDDTHRLCHKHFILVLQEVVVAGQDQAESLGDRIADHLEPLVKDVALQVNVLLNDVAVQVQSASIDISVQTEPLVNDFAGQVDFEFPEKVQAQDQTEHAHECHGCTQLTQENDKLLKSTAILSQESMKCNEVFNKWTAFEG